MGTFIVIEIIISPVESAIDKNYSLIKAQRKFNPLTECSMNQLKFMGEKI